jgi:hypothetical protein
MRDDDYIFDEFIEPARLDPGDIAPELLELEKIPRRAWEPTLAPLHRQLRFYAAQRIPDERLRELAYELVTELDIAETQRRRAGDETRYRARRTAAPLPVPDAAHAATRPTVQVNFRLRRDDHERLASAAAAVGLKPTALARALVLNGVAKVLEQRGEAAGGAGAGGAGAGGAGAGGAGAT